MYRRIGVTGTREGANSTQILSVIQFLETIEQPAELHHGDCKGVDEEVAVAAGEQGFKVICHPPEDDYLRAFHKSDEFRKPAGYFERDRAIVDSTDLLIVVPLQNTWQTRGGTWDGRKRTASWFSWMDENYPETCRDAKAVLEQLGFDCSYDTNGDLLLEHYDNKEGQEKLFMEAISTETLGEISWLGEDGETWQTTFRGNSVVEESESYLVDAPTATYQPLIP